MLIIAILFLPVIPFSSPGTMGGGSSSVMDHIITPYPPNQPDSLPVYRVTDYVDIVDDTTKIYDYDKDPYNQNDLREWMTKIFKDELDLPVALINVFNVSVTSVSTSLIVMFICGSFAFSCTM